MAHSRKTFLPGVLKLMRLLCRYLNRYSPQLRKIVPPAHHAKIDALFAACMALEEVIVPLLGDDEVYPTEVSPYNA